MEICRLCLRDTSNDCINIFDCNDLSENVAKIISTHIGDVSSMCTSIYIRILNYSLFYDR